MLFSPVLLYTQYTVVMKRPVCMMPALSLFWALLLAGCNLASMRSDFDKEEGKKVLAKAKFDRVLIDSTGEMQVYASMNRSDELQNESAILRFADPYKELYLLVFKDDVTDFKQLVSENDSLHRHYQRDTGSLLSIYSNITTGNTLTKLRNGRDSLFSSRKLHGMDYRGYAITGSYKNISLFYLKGIYKSSHSFYQVVVWTLGSRRNLYEGVMKKMIESLQEETNTLQ